MEVGRLVVCGFFNKMRLRIHTEIMCGTFVMNVLLF